MTGAAAESLASILHAEEPLPSCRSPACCIAARGEPGQGNHVWSAKTSGSFVTLTYGPLDADKAPLFLLSCFNGMGIAVLDLHPGLRDDTKPGKPLTIELKAGDQTAQVEGEATRDEASGIDLRRGERYRGEALLEVLREKRPGDGSKRSASTELPNAGRADAVSRVHQRLQLD